MKPSNGRVLVLAGLLSSAGLGLYQAGSAIYFVRSVGLSPTEVGTGLSIAGLAGLVCGLPLGQLADRIGPRTVAIGLEAFKAVPLTLALWAQNFWQFLLIVTALGIAEAGLAIANEAVVAGVTAGSSRVRISAYLRSVFNIGLTGGSLLAGLALAVGTRLAYQGLIFSYVVVSALVGLLYLLLPKVPGTERKAGSPFGAFRALRDVPYIAMAQLLCLSQLGDVVLTIGLPLWIVTSTDAPVALAAWIGAINTVLVATLQVRVAGAAETLTGAIRSHEWALGSFVVMCLLAGAAGYVSVVPAIVLLVLSVIALTAGEMLAQSARWQLRFSFAPPDAQGQYGAAFRLGLLIPRAAGPMLVTALTSQWRFAGWLVLGTLFAAGIAANRPMIGWAQRTREEVTAG